MSEDVSFQSDQPQLLSEYKLIHELGRNREGGRITYLANDLSTSQPVVIKQFRFVQTDSSWSGFKNYEREISILQSIQHPQIPRYIRSFETPDGFCMVQEYKDCSSLGEFRHLNILQIYDIAVNLLAVLDDIQSQVPPIIHRDIKPENILVDQDLKIYLIDFGLAKLNQEKTALSSVAAGTPGFMPPEEIFNRPLSPSADLYSVGATLISLLTGKESHEMSELLDDNYRLDFMDDLPPLSPLMMQWLTQMVEPNPRDRFANAREALSALKEIDISDLSTGRNSAPYHNKKTPRSARLLLIGLAVFGLSLVSLQFLSRQSSVETSSSKNVTTSLSPEEAWFKKMKPSCNTLEVVTAVQRNPYPPNAIGVGYGASCYALAGKLDLADKIIETLPPDVRIFAVQILFQIGHPVADSGDDESSGPIMDLVVKYWPENYMALYHAGMSAYILEKNQKAIDNLEAFLDIYRRDDSWTNKAKLAISNIEQGILADERFRFHH